MNMVVVVASTITQSGSTEFGHHQAPGRGVGQPGYGPDPGHDGYGKIIATIC